MIKKVFGIISVLVFIPVFIISFKYSESVSHLTLEALDLCVKSVLPSVFLFAVITQLLSRSGIARYAGNVLSFILTPLTGIPKELCGAFLTGIFGGFPNGAHASGLIYAKGLCSKNNAELCTALSNNCSIPFMLSFIGIKTLGSIKNGLIIVASQLICILIISFVMRQRNTDYKNCIGVSEDISKKQNAFEILCQSITASCAASLNICGFIAFFYIISGLIASVSGCNETILPLVKGTFEISSGISSVNGITFPTSFIVCSAITGFSGLSVICQVDDACAKYGLSSEKFIFSRLINAVLMPIVTSVMLIFLPVNCVEAFACGSYLNYSTYTDMKPLTALVLYAVFFVLVMCFFAVLYFLVLLYERKTENAKRKID